MMKAENLELKADFLALKYLYESVRKMFVFVHFFLRAISIVLLIMAFGYGIVVEEYWHQEQNTESP